MYKPWTNKRINMLMCKESNHYFDPLWSMVTIAPPWQNPQWPAFLLCPTGMTRRATPWTDSLWPRWEAAGEDSPTGRPCLTSRRNTWDTETRYTCPPLCPDKHLCTSNPARGCDFKEDLFEDLQGQAESLPLHSKLFMKVLTVSLHFFRGHSVPPNDPMTSGPVVHYPGAGGPTRVGVNHQ